MTDRAKTRVADEVKEFAPSISMKVPNGVCFSPDGLLYVAEQNRVLLFPAAEFFYEGPDVAAANVVPQGELIPAEEESFNHGARVCRIGPDDKLYITLGQPVQRAGQGEDWRSTTRSASAASCAWTATARTARSSRAACATRSAWTSTRRTRRSGSPTTRSTAWATTSRRANSTAPTKAGQHFGFPWYGGGKVRTVEYKDETPPADVVVPAGRDGGARGRPRHDVLPRQHVPGEVPGRHLLARSTARGTAPRRSAPA